MTGQYVITKGNLFQSALLRGNSRPVFLTHVVNDLGKFGAGFAHQLAIEYPNAHASYLVAVQGAQRDLLGSVAYGSLTNNVCVAHMFAQRGIRDPHALPGARVPIRYGALARCMERIASVATSVDIIAPKFGSGLAGGDWKVIEQMIWEIWCDRGMLVAIYEL